MKKVVIVDDEAAGRKLIREYLEEYPNLIVLGEANNGVDAVKEINKFKPDLVFLDVQMPGLTGFEVLTHLEELPRVIFSTAYDQYALKAFEVHAIDYLLKPYTKERFRTAVERLNDDLKGLGELTESLHLQPSTYPSKFLVQKGRKMINLALDQVEWIEAYGDYCKLHTQDEHYLSNYGISTLEDRLDPNRFLRVHRSHIVNLNAIAEVEKYGKGYQARMENGDKVKVSRSFTEQLKKYML